MKVGDGGTEFGEVDEVHRAAGATGVALDWSQARNYRDSMGAAISTGRPSCLRALAIVTVVKRHTTTEPCAKRLGIQPRFAPLRVAVTGGASAGGVCQWVRDPSRAAAGSP